MTPRHILLAKAALSAGPAIVLVAAREPLSRLAARREPPQRFALMTAALLDVGWVVGSVIVLLVAWPALVPAGRLLIIAAALIVEACAFLQGRPARTVATAPEAGR